MAKQKSKKKVKSPADESAEARSKPKQNRGVETFNAILDAATELFAEKGYEQTTTHQIADKANVSVGALYRYFGGKQPILEEVYRREAVFQRRRILSSFSLNDLRGKDLPQLVRKVMKLAFNIYAENPGLRKVLIEQARKLPELADLRRQQETEIHAAASAILRAAPGVKIPDIDIGAYLIALFLEALVDDFMLYKKPRLDEDRVIDAASDFILRYALGHLDPKDTQLESIFS